MKIILTVIITLPIVLRDIKSGYLLFRLKDNKQHISAPRTLEHNVTSDSAVTPKLTTKPTIETSETAKKNISTTLSTKTNSLSPVSTTSKVSTNEAESPVTAKSKVPTNKDETQATTISKFSTKQIDTTVSPLSTSMKEQSTRKSITKKDVSLRTTPMTKKVTTPLQTTRGITVTTTPETSTNEVTTDEVTTTKNEPCVDNEYWCQFVAYDLEQCERYPCVKKEACRRTCGECTDNCSNPTWCNSFGPFGCTEKCINGWNVCVHQFHPSSHWVPC